MGKVFKSVWFWVSLSSLLLALILFFLLPLMGAQGIGSRLLGAAIPLIIGLIVILIVQFVRMQKALKQKDSTQSFAGFSDKSLMANTWLEPLREETLAALSILKQSGKSKVKVGQNPLDLFLFYLMIGAEGSGKSSLLENGGVHFPRVYPEERQRAAQTQHFSQWNFSNQGIFIETPARYLSGLEGDDEFQAWLSIIEKEGKSKALDGLLLVVSLKDLLGNDNIEDFAAKFRDRIGLIQTTLKLELPVYLMFTHADLIPGFAEFFDNLQGLEAEQILGATFSLSGNLAPAKQRFEREFKKIWEGVIRKTYARLAQTQGATKPKVFLFHNELGAAQEKLASFVEFLFKTNLRKESALFRGFFLTSITSTLPDAGAAFASSPQSGDTIIGHVLNPRAAQKAPVFAQPGAGPKVVTYFTKLFFSGVLKNDKSLARISAYRLGSLSKRSLWGSIIVGTVAFLLLCYSSIGFIQSYRFSSETADVALVASHLKWREPAAFAKEFSSLEKLYEAIQKLQQIRTEGSSWMYPPGYLHASSALEAAIKMHAFQVENMVARDALRQLEASLQISSQYFNPNDRSVLYDKLKLYLVLSEKGQENLENVDADVIGTQLSAIWTDQLLSKIGAENAVSNMANSLDKHAKLYAHAIVDKKIRPPSIGDPKVIADARQALLGSPSIEGLFSSVVNRFSDAPDIALNDMGVPADALLRHSGRIRGIYTHAAYDGTAMDALEHGAQEPHQKDWVIGQEMALPEDMKDERQLHKALVERYYQAYAQEWVQYLQGLTLSMPGELSLASAKIIAYASTNQGLPAVLGKLQEEVDLDKAPTKMEKATDAKLNNSKLGRLKALLFEGGRDPKKELKQKFAFIDKLNGNAGNGELQSYFNALKSLGDVMGQLAINDDGGTAALEFTQDIFAGKPQNPVSIAWREARASLDQAPDDAKAWLTPLLENPIRDAVSILIGFSEKKLEEMYKDNVVNFYTQKFQGRYPFVKGAGQETNLEDLKVFFNSADGKLAKFMQARLGPVVKYADGALTVKHWNGLKIRIRPEAVKTLEQGLQISGRLYMDNSATPRLYSTGFILAESPNTASVSFRLGADKIQVKNKEGQAKQRIRWPGENVQDGAELAVNYIGGGSEIKRFDGPFGMFKLLDAARAFSPQASGFTAKWRFRVAQKYDIDVKLDGDVQEAEHPFVNPDFFKFECSPTLIDNNAQQQFSQH